VVVSLAFFFWQYTSGQTFNLISNHSLVCNTFNAYIKTLLIFSFVLFCFVSLRTNVLHGVAKEGMGMTWEKDGHRFIYKVEVSNYCI
jgi:hypothetical protein